VSGEIEFVDPDPRPQPKPAPAGSRSEPAAWVAALGWTAATVLAVVAPFQRLYGSGSGLPRRYADYLPVGSGSVNGWGNGAAIGPRFGIVLVACAAVCAILAVAAWARVLGRRTPLGKRLFGSASVAAPCLLAGVIGTLATFLASQPDMILNSAAQAAVGFTAYVPLNQDQAFSSHLSVTFTGSTVGHSWCLWLAVAALVCAVVAAVAQSLANQPGPHLAG
jgi:hypothetical protein